MSCFFWSRNSKTNPSLLFKTLNLTTRMRFEYIRKFTADITDDDTCTGHQLLCIMCVFAVTYSRARAEKKEALLRKK